MCLAEVLAGMSHAGTMVGAGACKDEPCGEDVFSGSACKDESCREELFSGGAFKDGPRGK